MLAILHDIRAPFDAPARLAYLEPGFDADSDPRFVEPNGRPVSGAEVVAIHVTEEQYAEYLRLWRHHEQQQGDLRERADQVSRDLSAEFSEKLSALFRTAPE